jgi:hypothetical protein
MRNSYRMKAESDEESSLHRSYAKITPFVIGFDLRREVVVYKKILQCRRNTQNVGPSCLTPIITKDLETTSRNVAKSIGHQLDRHHLQHHLHVQSCNEGYVLQKIGFAD